MPFQLFNEEKANKMLNNGFTRYKVIYRKSENFKNILYYYFLLDYFIEVIKL